MVLNLSIGRRITPYLVYLILIATLGPVQFGFHLAELNAPEAVMRCQKQSIITTGNVVTIQVSRPPQCIPMNSAQFGLVQSIYTLGGLVGALAAGPLSTKFGRLRSMLQTTIFFITGPLLEALSPNITILAGGRLISGIGAGASIVVVPLYISEIAPAENKGMFGAMTQIMTNLGILISQTLGYFLSHDSSWRIILVMAAAIALLHLAGLSKTPESPVWLAEHKSAGLAKRVMQRIRGQKADVVAEISSWGVQGVDNDDRTDEEDSLLSHSNQTAPSPSKHSSRAPIGFVEALTMPPYRRAVSAVIGIMIIQQFTGINSIIMYSVSILTTVIPSAAPLIAVFISILNLFVTAATSPLPDKLGRKPTLLLSISGMGVSAFVLAISISRNIRVLSVVFTLVFVVSFAVGLGPVPFILASELVGPEAVASTQSCALAANWIATFVVAQGFPVLNEILPRGKSYFVFAAVAVFGFFFVAAFVPETKGRAVGEDLWVNARERRRREADERID